MILVFQSNKTQSGAKGVKSNEKREIFVNKLIMNGLQLEFETAQLFVRCFVIYLAKSTSPIFIDSSIHF